MTKKSINKKCGYCHEVIKELRCGQRYHAECSKIVDKLRRNKVTKEYYKKNRQRIRERIRTYRSLNRNKLLKAHRKYYRKNREKFLEYRRKNFTQFTFLGKHISIFTDGVTEQIKPLIPSIKNKVLEDCIKHPRKFLKQNKEELKDER